MNIPISINTITPLTLKMRCMSAVRFAFFVLVRPAIRAVTQVPILEPIVI